MNKLLKCFLFFWIPRGFYCYSVKRVSPDGSLEKIPCPFFEWKQDIHRDYPQVTADYSGRCNWLDVENEPNLNDQCKICGIRENPLVFSIA